MWIIVYRGERGDLYWNEEIQSWKRDRSAATRFNSSEEAILSYQGKSLMVSKHIYVEEYNMIPRLIQNLFLAAIVLIVVIYLISNGSKW